MRNDEIRALAMQIYLQDREGIRWDGRWAHEDMDFTMEDAFAEAQRVADYLHRLMSKPAPGCMAAPKDAA